jgi:hypothetical protein
MVQLSCTEQRTDFLMAKTAFKVEIGKAPNQQVGKTHNRWHPNAAFVQWFNPGDDPRFACYT